MKSYIPYKTTRLAASLAAALGGALAPAVGHADITLTFSDNTTPLASFPGTVSTAPFTQNGQGAWPEYRMFDPAGAAGGGFPVEKDAIFGGEQWIFDSTTGQMTGVSGTAPTGGVNPGYTGPYPGTSADPAGGPGVEQSALFFGSPFNFLAPYAGTPAANTYGTGTVSVNGSSLTVRFPVLEAQWGGVFFPLGQENNGGITFTGTIAPDNHTFVITAEHLIAASEDPNGAGFGGWTTQWELHGTLNSDPVCSPLSKGVIPGGVLTVNATDVATDPDTDTVQITNVDQSALTNGSVDTTSMPTSVDYTTAVAGTESFTVAISDGNGGTCNTTVTVTAATNPPPLANNDTDTTNQDTAVTTNVVANDTDGNGDLDPNTVAIVSNASNGNAVPTGGGNVQYTPNAGFTGTDSYTYTVNDAASTSNVATVTITVNAATPSTKAGPVTPAGTNGLTSVVVSATDLLNAGIPADQNVTSSCDPNCFDFVAPTTSGIATVVLPLSGPLPANASYRKFKGGNWVFFDTTQGDTIASAAGAPGSCPPPGSPAYTSPIQSGHFCLELTIADGGPNDADSIAGQVTDPSGPASGGGTPVPAGGEEINGGCTLGSAVIGIEQRADWWLLAAFATWLGLRKRYRPMRK